MFYLLESRVITRCIAYFAVVFKYDPEVVFVFLRYVLQIELIWVYSCVLVVLLSDAHLRFCLFWGLNLTAVL